ncbi:MAG: FG-GAP-like repeat-containing protein, partial [Bacteroidetes bacterium]|nr:FG-GAP-like repeat-containing protein [Bacteroidota bacterium]
MRKLLLFSALLLGLFQIQSVQAQNCSAPTITTFTPNTGFIGSIVTIKGSNFDANPANDQVFFGATQAQVLSASFGSLTVKVPVGTTYAPISVRNGCGLIGVSSTSFNAIFCPTTVTSTTYNTVSYSMNVSGGYQMISQDMDLDGKPDLLVCGFTANAVSIARNLSSPGNFNFAPKFDLAFSGATRCIAPGDFDGDGKIDIAVVDNGIDGIKIYRNLSVPGSLSFAAPYSLSASGAYQVTTGDLNGDGKLDLACTSGNNVRTFLNTLNTSAGAGAIAFSANTVINNTYYATGIAIVDVDGDGTKDIGTSCPSDNLVTAIKNTTTGGSNTFTFGSVNAFATNSAYPYRLFVGDFDKDGKIDFVTNNFSGATTSIFRNTSAGSISFAAAVNLTSPSSNYRLGVGDADGDGKPDLVTKSSGENLFSVYVNTSSGAGNISFANRIDYPGQAEVSGILIADLDLDFVPDIATSGISYNTLRVHRNQSSVTDNSAPTAVCKNVTIALDPTGHAVLTAEMVDNGSSDACGIGSISIDKTAFTCANIGANTVVLTVTDRAGNVATCSATVTVAPAAVIVAGQATVCAGQTVALSANLGDTYQWFKDGVAINGATTQNYTATTSGDYSVEVTNAGGCSGVSSATTVTIGEAQAVTTTVSGPLSLCQGNTVTITSSQASSYKWNTGSTASSITVGTAGTYSVTVYDDNGCSSTSAPVVVTVKSGALPTASISAAGATTFCDGESVVLTSAANASYLWSNGATTQSITTTQSGSYSVTVTNADGCFAVSSAIDVTVKPNPSVVASGDARTCDREVQLNAVGNNNGASSTPVYTKVCLFTSNGSCDLSGNICSDSYAWINSTNWSTTQTTSGAMPMSMDYNLYFTSCGGAVSFNLILNGALLQSVTNNENSCTCTPNTYPWKVSIPANVFASHWNASGTNTYAIEMIGNSQAVTGMTVVVGFPGSSYSWSPAAGLNDASVANPLALPAETTDYVVTYTSGNGCIAKDTATVTVSCNTAPVAVCQALTLSTDASCSASAEAVQFDGGSTDAEGDAMTFSVLPAGPYAIGTTNVVLTVSDAKGLSSTCATTVTVADNTAPIALAQDLTIQLDANGQASITAADVNNGSSDACGIASLTLDKTSFDCSNVGANTVTLTVVDVNGNSSSANAVVTVEDKVAAVVVTQDLTIQLDANGQASITAADVNNGSSDACGIASLTLDKTSFDCSNAGANTVTLT